MAFKGNLKKRFQKADAQGATLAIMVDAERWASGALEAKVLRTGEQRLVTANAESGLDVFDEIYALTYMARSGLPRSGLHIEHGGRLGIISSSAASEG